MTDRDEIMQQIASQLDMSPLTELPEGGGHYADWLPTLPVLPVDTSDDDTPCIPIPCRSLTDVAPDLFAQQISSEQIGGECVGIPCPSFTDVDLGKVQPIAWDGIDITVMEPNDDFTSQTPFAQAESLWETLTAHADLTRKSHRYSDDTAIVVRLPDNPALAEIFAVVKARAIHGSPIMIRLASEETDE